MTEPVFCQNCGRSCDKVHKGSDGLSYCSRECEIRNYIMVEYEWVIFLMIVLLIPATALTARYMIDKYSPATQEQEEQK